MKKMRNSDLSRPVAVAVIACAALFLFSGCATQKRTRYSRKKTPDFGRLHAGRLATEYIHELNRSAARGDFDAFLELWADDLEHTVARATVRTKDELGEFFREWTDMFAKWEHVEERRVVQGNRVAWEGTAQGTHRSTGKRLSLPVVMFMEFDPAGKMKTARVYFDTGVLQQQLVTSP